MREALRAPPGYLDSSDVVEGVGDEGLELGEALGVVVADELVDDVWGGTGGPPKNPSAPRPAPNPSPKTPQHKVRSQKAPPKPSF